MLIDLCNKNSELIFSLCRFRELLYGCSNGIIQLPLPAVTYGPAQRSCAGSSCTQCGIAALNLFCCVYVVNLLHTGKRGPCVELPGSFLWPIRKVMKKELYFDISSAEKGGSLFRISDGAGTRFYYSHSTYDDKKDEVKVFETNFESFAAFWQYLVQNKEWFYLHPLFVHPEQRDFIREQLKSVNWGIHPNKKWQESHQRQWKKVLSGPGSYYQPSI